MIAKHFPPRVRHPHVLPPLDRRPQPLAHPRVHPIPPPPPPPPPPTPPPPPPPPPTPQPPPPPPPPRIAAPRTIGAPTDPAARAFIAPPAARRKTSHASTDRRSPSAAHAASAASLPRPINSPPNPVHDPDLPRTRAPTHSPVKLTSWPPSSA